MSINFTDWTKGSINNNFYEGSLVRANSTTVTANSTTANALGENPSSALAWS